MRPLHKKKKMPPRPQLLALFAAILCVSLVGISLSLSLPLLSFALESRGASATFIGLNTGMAGAATLMIAPLVPGLAARLSVAGLLLIALLGGAATLLAFWFTPNIWLWFPLRYAFGAALAVLFVLSEFWINAAAPEKSRGLVMGIYAAMLSVGFACGPFLLTLLDQNTVWPYAIGASLFILATAPVMLAGRLAPRLEPGESPTSVFEFMRVAPAATLAAFVFGAIETGSMSLFPLYGMDLGYTATHSALIVTTMALGNIVAQIPLGILSDRMSRFRILLILATIGAVGAALLPLVSANPYLFFTLIAVWGGLSAGMYTVGLAHLGARYKGADLANANASFVMLYSLGIILGPPLLGAGFDLYNPHGLPLSISLLFIGYIVWVKARQRACFAHKSS
jgi:MFS family permease